MTERLIIFALGMMVPVLGQQLEKQRWKDLTIPSGKENYSISLPGPPPNDKGPWYVKCENPEGGIAVCHWSTPMDVPAIADGSVQCFNGTDKAVACRLTCEDKSRILEMSEDGKGWCRRPQP